MTDVVIPARNEASTIGPIVTAFRQCADTGIVYVVDDQSTDDTASVARQAGALVVSGAGLGKGQAMMAGLAWVQSRRVVFCDADLTGFTSYHAELLQQNIYGEIIGVLDGWFTKNNSGLRSLPTNLVRGLTLNGWAAEKQITKAVKQAGLPITLVMLNGVHSKPRAGLLRRIDVAIDYVTRNATS